MQDLQQPVQPSIILMLQQGNLIAANSGVTIDLGLVTSGNGFSITGGTGADTLKGSSGNDIILGGNDGRYASR